MPEHQQTQQSTESKTTFQKQATSVVQIPVSNPYSIIQRAKINPRSLTRADIMQLQRTIGNQAVGRLLSSIGSSSTAQQAPVQRQEMPEEEKCPSCMQRQEIPEEEEPLQGKMTENLQRQEIPEEEEPLQGKMIETVQRQEIPEEEEPLQGKMAETVQRQEIPEEEEPLQGKMAETIQRQEIPEEEEPLQGKFESGPEKETCPSCMLRQEIPEEEEPLQGKMIGTIQRQEIPEEEEPLQGKFENKPEIACPSCSAAPIIQKQEIPEEEETLQGKFETVQRQEISEEEEPLQTKRENNTGMPDNLKAGVESLSGIDMSDVRVHYNSNKPTEVGALAYTQGTNIHVAPGQERHLPHEAWHVIQQKQRRVQPTMQMQAVQINDDVSLEREADEMGLRAQSEKQQKTDNNNDRLLQISSKEYGFSNQLNFSNNIIQGIFHFEDETTHQVKLYDQSNVNELADFILRSGMPINLIDVGYSLACSKTDYGNYNSIKALRMFLIAHLPELPQAKLRIRQTKPRGPPAKEILPSNAQLGSEHNSMMRASMRAYNRFARMSLAFIQGNTTPHVAVAHFGDETDKTDKTYVASNTGQKTINEEQRKRAFDLMSRIFASDDPLLIVKSYIMELESIRDLKKSKEDELADGKKRSPNKTAALKRQSSECNRLLLQMTSPRMLKDLRKVIAMITNGYPNDSQGDFSHFQIIVEILRANLDKTVFLGIEEPVSTPTSDKQGYISCHGEMLILNELKNYILTHHRNKVVEPDAPDGYKRVEIGGVKKDCLACHWAFDIFNQYIAMPHGYLVTTSGQHGILTAGWQAPTWMEQSHIDMMAERVQNAKGFSWDKNCKCILGHIDLQNKQSPVDSGSDYEFYEQVMEALSSLEIIYGLLTAGQHGQQQAASTSAGSTQSM